MYLITKQEKKKNLGMLIDQKMNDGIKTTFFGRNVMTASAIAKFAIKNISAQSSQHYVSERVESNLK